MINIIIALCMYPVLCSYTNVNDGVLLHTYPRMHANVSAIYFIHKDVSNSYHNKTRTPLSCDVERVGGTTNVKEITCGKVKIIMALGVLYRYEKIR